MIYHSDRKLIVVEGVPCAGKTGLVRRLKENFGYSIVSEISQMLKDGEQFPGNGIDYDGVVEVADWFLQKEIERNRIAKDKLRNGDVGMDRGFLTSLAYNIAYENLTGIRSAEYLNRRIFSRVADGTFLIPTAYLYLEISPEVMEQRLRARTDRPNSVLPEFWLDPMFILPFIESYERFLRQGDILVKRIDATKTQEHVFEECVGFLRSLD